MRVSLITVCHKSRQKLAAYVQSFLEYHKRKEDFSTYEFVFVENSGDSEIKSAVKPLVDAGFEVVVLNSENEGFGRGCNSGAREATGDLLIFVNPDIRFLCDLSTLQVLTQPITWGTVQQITGKGSDYSIDLFPEHKGILFEILQLHRFVNQFPRRFLRYSYVVGSFMFVSKELFIRSGGFDPAFFLYHEEAEFARRLQTLSGPPNLCTTVSVFHEGFGSHNSREEILRHEADGFLTYCKITRQPALVHKRLRTFQLLGLLSSASRWRFQVLQKAVARDSQ